MLTMSANGFWVYTIFGIKSIHARFLSKWSLVMWWTRLLLGASQYHLFLFFFFLLFTLSLSFLLLKYYGSFICVLLLIHYLLPFGLRSFFYPSFVLLFRCICTFLNLWPFQMTLVQLFWKLCGSLNIYQIIGWWWKWKWKKRVWQNMKLDSLLKLHFRFWILH